MKHEKKNSNSGTPFTRVNTTNRARTKAKKDISSIASFNCK